MDDHDLTAEARSLLQQAAREPRSVFTSAARLLKRAQESDAQGAAAVAGRAIGLAALHLGRIDAAVGYLEAAVACARAAESEELAAEARMTLAFAFSRRGDSRRALATIDQAVAGSSGVAHARALAQRGPILKEFERFDDAEADYRLALPALRKAGDWLWVTRVHNNRGYLRISRGQFAAGEADLEQAEALATAHGLDLQRAVAIENLAFLHVRRGDVPKALARLDEAERRQAAVGMHAATVRIDRGELLLGVGLLPEAREAAETAVAELRRARWHSARSEAQLLLAEAYLAAGDIAAARRTAGAAARGFRRQQRLGLEALARQLVLRCRLATGEGQRAAAREALMIAAQLDRTGFTLQALDTRLLAARLHLEQGDIPAARHALDGSASARGRGPVALRVRAWHAEALLRVAEGRRSGALAALHAGARLVEEYQAALGATDLRSSVSAARSGLVGLGLDLSLRGGHARDVLHWADQGRATALLTRPVRPPNDPDLAQRLGELRGVVAAIDEARSSGRPVDALVRRQLDLERAVRDLARRSSAPGMAGQHPSVDALVATVGEGALVEFVEHGGVLHAVTVAAGHVRRHEVAPLDTVLHRLEHLQFGLRRLISGHRRPAGLAAALQLVRELGGRLEEDLLRPLRPVLGDRPLVVVPTGRLQALPWSLLPGCRGRPVTVAPCAALWYQAVRTPLRAGPVVAAAGPDLEAAEDEVRALGRIHPGAQVLTGADATVDAVRAGLARASVGHIAAHGRFRADNALFSQLRLADGPLTVYDLESLSAVPGLVVLAACDAARSALSGGEELLGLAAAFLSLGTTTLVAPMIPVDDPATARLTVALHERLARAVTPAAALAAVQAEAIADGDPVDVASAAGIVCLGADRPVPRVPTQAHRRQRPQVTMASA
jgi:tetratricopeptide (TPR) repeat protein